MKRTMLLTAAMPALIVSVGCASVDTFAPSHVVDTQKMVAVDRAAASAGVRVIWIHPPTRMADPRSGG